MVRDAPWPERVDAQRAQPAPLGYWQQPVRGLDHHTAAESYESQIRVSVPVDDHPVKLSVRRQEVVAVRRPVRIRPPGTDRPFHSYRGPCRGFRLGGVPRFLLGP